MKKQANQCGHLIDHLRGSDRSPTGFIITNICHIPFFAQKYIVKKVKPLEKYVGWGTDGDILKM